MTQPTISDMIGMTFISVENLADERLVFTSDKGWKFTFFHSQDCCEDVSIEDVIGDLNDLAGSPLLQAEEVSSENEPKPQNCNDSHTWTFYKFASIKGSVTVRWLGQSNGYYSESVDLFVIPGTKGDLS